MPSMVMSTLQGLVSSAFVYAGFCAPLALYAVFKEGSGEMAWFTCVAFFLMSLYITQVRTDHAVTRGESEGGSARAGSTLSRPHRCPLAALTAPPVPRPRTAADAGVLFLGGQRLDQRARPYGAAHLPRPGGPRGAATACARPVPDDPA